MKELYWLSWIAFILSALIILYGSLTLLKYVTDRGVYYTYAGFIGLSISGFFMTVAHGVYGGGFIE